MQVGSCSGCGCKVYDDELLTCSQCDDFVCAECLTCFEPPLCSGCAVICPECFDPYPSSDRALHCTQCVSCDRWRCSLLMLQICCEGNLVCEDDSDCISATMNTKPRRCCPEEDLVCRRHPQSMCRGCNRTACPEHISTCRAKHSSCNACLLPCADCDGRCPSCPEHTPLDCLLGQCYRCERDLLCAQHRNTHCSHCYGQIEAGGGGGWCAACVSQRLQLLSRASYGDDVAQLISRYLQQPPCLPKRRREGKRRRLAEE